MSFPAKRVMAACGCSLVSGTVHSPLVAARRPLYTGTTPLLQRRRKEKFGMSNRRLMMQQRHYCKPGPSIPIFILIMSFATFNIFYSRWGANDDSYYG